MPEIQLGTHTLKSHGLKVANVHKYDWMILLVLGAIDITLNVIEPFHRFLNQDMMTDLKYPFQPDTVPMWCVPIYTVFLPVGIFFAFYFVRKDIYDLHHAMLGLAYSILITLVITDSIKDAVGRPRPDFFYRCFPDGQGAYDAYYGDVLCTGDNDTIREGYKSFPSGHSSVSFAGLGFLAWYLAGKIKAFDRRGHAAKLCIVIFPLLCAALVAVSRVDDYWHHWADVFTGSLIGIVIASVCYLQSFPFPNQENGWAPHVYFRVMAAQLSDASATRLNNLNTRRPDVEAPVDSSPPA
ncbi:lipid phosphate phosphatase 2 [Rosa sericea]